MNFDTTINQNMAFTSVLLHWPPSIKIMDEQFFDFCLTNDGFRIERNAQGDCEIMAPTGGQTGWMNSKLNTLLSIWAEQEGSGIVFDSATGFILPNEAIRSPDVSWVKRTRLAALTPQQKQRFLPLCPDFVLELRSPSDRMKPLQDKMQEYIENGAGLGWLIDPEDRQVFIYQAEKAVIKLEQPEFLAGESVLPEFKLELQRLWDVDF